MICDGLAIGENENHLVLIEEDVVAYAHGIGLVNVAHFLIAIWHPTTKMDGAIEEAG